MNKLNVVVKVGKSSKLKMRNVNCHRAITFDDINYFVDKFNLKTVIMENLQSFEVVDALSQVENLTNKGISVFICDYANNNYAQTIASKAGTELATSLTGLQHSIAQSLSVSVMTNWAELDKIDDFNDLSYVPKQKQKDVKKITSLDLDKSDEEDEDILEDSITEDNSEKEEELLKLLDQITAEKNALQEEMDTKSQRITKLMDMVDGLQEQRDMYKSILDDINQYVVVYQADVVTNIDEVNAIKEELQQSKDTILKKENLIESMVREKSTLDMQIESLVEYKDKFETLQKSSTELNTKIITYESEKKEWTKREKDYDNKLQESLSEIERLQKSVNDFEAKWGELNQQQQSVESLQYQLTESQQSNSQYLIQINSLNLEKNRLIQEQGELEQQIRGLNAQVQQLKFISNVSTSNEEKEMLEKEIERLNEMFKATTEKLSSEHNARSINNLMFLESLTAINEKDKENAKNQGTINDLKEKINKYETQLSESQEKYNALNKKFVQATSEIEDITKSNEEEKNTLNEQLGILTTQIQKLRNEKADNEEQSKQNYKHLQELELQVMQLQAERDSSTAELDKAQEQASGLQIQLEEKSQEIETLQQSLIETQEELKSKIESSIQLTEIASQETERQKTLETAHKTLQVAMKKAVNELNETKRQLVSSEAMNKKLEASYNKLNQSFLNLVGYGGVSGVSSGKVEFKCQYTSSGKIIPVFGTGSYGITNIAMSIAKSIKDSRILIMDLDLMGGKMDVFTKLNPIIQDLPDIQQVFDKTSLCSFVTKGYTYFNTYRDKIIRMVAETSLRSTIDYFSGLCGKLNTSKFVMTDFSPLLNDIGGIYDYIIVDLGKVGTSDTTDALIKMFTDISPKSICVTLNDGATCRNASVKLQLAGVDASKLHWVLNLAVTTAVDEMTKKSVGKSTYTVIPQEMRIYNNPQHITLNKVNTLKAKIQDLVEQVVD
jgi:hypothetical protein